MCVWCVCLACDLSLGLVLAKLSVSLGGCVGGGRGGPALPAASLGLGGDHKQKKNHM